LVGGEPHQFFAKADWSKINKARCPSNKNKPFWWCFVCEPPVNCTSRTGYYRHGCVVHAKKASSGFVCPIVDCSVARGKQRGPYSAVSKKEMREHWMFRHGSLPLPEQFSAPETKQTAEKRKND
jgi:hypothetical protein